MKTILWHQEVLWNYHIDEVNVAANENNEASNYRINKTAESRSFEYKTKMAGSTSANNNRLDAEVVVLLKYLSNF